MKDENVHAVCIAADQPSGGCRWAAWLRASEVRKSSHDISSQDLVSVCSKSEPSVAGVITIWG